MSNRGLVGLASLAIALVGCGGPDGDSVKEPATPTAKPTVIVSTTPTVANRPAPSCDLPSERGSAQITLEETADTFVATFTGHPIGTSGTTGYFITIFDRSGNNGAQLGILFKDGVLQANYVVGIPWITKTNLKGKPRVVGDKVVGTFPKDAENLRDFTATKWQGDLSRNGSHVGRCPADGHYQPFRD